MDKRQELELNMMKLKSLAYDILAQQEFHSRNHKSTMEELQKQLTETNKQIMEVDKNLRSLDEVGPEKQ